MSKPKRVRDSCRSCFKENSKSKNRDSQTNLKALPKEISQIFEEAARDLSNNRGEMNKSKDSDEQSNIKPNAISYGYTKTSKAMKNGPFSINLDKITNPSSGPARRLYREPEPPKTEKSEMSTQTILNEYQKAKDATIEGVFKSKTQPLDFTCTVDENTFFREDGSNIGIPLITSPPSAVNALRALQNKIKNLESENEAQAKTIIQLSCDLKSEQNEVTKKLELEILELKSRMHAEVTKLNND